MNGVFGENIICFVEIALKREEDILEFQINEIINSNSRKK